MNSDNFDRWTDHQIKVYTTSTVLEGLAIPIVAGAWLASLVYVKGSQDEARRCFGWVKSAMPSLILYVQPLVLISFLFPMGIA